MTPKKKAEDLVHKIFLELPPRLGRYEIAKNCALIAVDEIRDHSSPYFIENQDGKFVSFWQEVKQEIDKL